MTLAVLAPHRSRRRRPLAAPVAVAALAALLAGRALVAQPGAPLALARSAASACEDRDVTLSATQGGQAVADAAWSFAPADAGTFVTAQGALSGTAFGPSVVFRRAAPASTPPSVTRVTVTAARGGTRVSTEVALGRICNAPFGGELIRATLGFEQVGASGITGDQKYNFDVFITRPIPLSGPFPRFFSVDAPRNHYLGAPLRWWGDVRIASYPQQVTTAAAAFATGFVTSAGKLTVNKLVQTAEFTSGLELRVWGSGRPVRGFPDPAPARFALMLFGGGGAVGPFPLATEDPPVFAVPADARSPQRLAFDSAYRGVTTPYVAFRPEAPDRFLVNLSGGLRLYTFYTNGTTGEPLATAPAMVSVAFGRNDLIVPARRRATHVSAYYPFPTGSRADPTTIIIYLFGDVWMGGGRSNFSAPSYQLTAAVGQDGKAVAASNPDVTIITVRDEPRDTYRLGVSIDLLKVWQRLFAAGSAQRGTTSAGAATTSSTTSSTTASATP